MKLLTGSDMETTSMINAFAQGGPPDITSPSSSAVETETGV